MIGKKIKALYPGIDISKATPNQMKQGKKVVRDKFLATLTRLLPEPMVRAIAGSQSSRYRRMD